MLDINSVPFERALGKQVGEAIQLMHEKNGVRFRGGAIVKEIISGDDGKVKSVVLEDGTTLDADMVIMATGVRPNTKYLEGSGIELAKDGGIICDPFLETNVKDVFAAGDVASYPYWPTGSRTRTEHWSAALDMGTNAAFNMLDKYVPYADVPFFWTRHYNKSLQVIGALQVGYKECHIRGKPHKGKFLAFYINENDVIVGVAGMNKQKDILRMHEAMEQNLMPKGSEIKSGKVRIKEIRDRLKSNPGAGRCKRANCCQKQAAKL